ncbi:universal stress protein [Kocuria rosea]|uniref:universal stress protein n=1 Tax=Kocuria rosea TaxID=1275 RepID=UPI000D649570|nr:universal stress protein [Kocuria rosea]MEB2529086.1 universal stress protein [Kocuria rosea]MEB2619529.1 universal stress protein [Kocuria rosea]PWF81866.1 universal stress protein [Kocuria rosea]QCY31675.1 universal stress protein [Kocuria rosea]TQN39093.1 nucleotide-binding universal stress UspA family protein [Kocuria rosea]
MNATETFRIVVGVDGSPESLRALEWAVTEARLRQGQVHVVTAWQHPAMVTGDDLEWDLTSYETRARHLQNQALRSVHAEQQDTTGEVVQGQAAAVLIEASTGADLLVVGSHGYGGFTGLLLGSVSNQVVHHARCPVLVVKPRHQGRL